eukprot:3138017-Rhodomonas_salina.4
MQVTPGCKEHLFKTTQDCVDRENAALNKGPTPITEVPLGRICVAASRVLKKCSRRLCFCSWPARCPASQGQCIHDFHGLVMRDGLAPIITASHHHAYLFVFQSS